MALYTGDRRKYKRYTIDLYADYAFTKIWEDIIEKGIVRDMGYGGLRLDAHRRLNKRSHFTISVKSDALDAEITVTGRAKWIKKQNGTTTYGIELEWVSDEDTYKRYIKTLEEADKIY